MEQEQIRSIKDILSISLDYFNTLYNEEYFRDIIRKYQDNVVAYLIDQEGNICIILLKGKIKFFGVYFNLDIARLYRIYDKEMREELFRKELVITNKESWDLFEKKMILNSLENNQVIE